jgi:hypothetical protein
MLKRYYNILNISPDASLEEVKSAYRVLAKEYHPDHHPDKEYAEQRMKEINEAYREIVRDRMLYPKKGDRKEDLEEVAKEIDYENDPKYSWLNKDKREYPRSRNNTIKLHRKCITIDEELRIILLFLLFIIIVIVSLSLR